jgi:copper chaperone
VAAQLTSGQVIAALQQAGYEANRVSEPRQIHVSGGSTCCGSCS